MAVGKVLGMPGPMGAIFLPRASDLARLPFSSPIGAAQGVCLVVDSLLSDRDFDDPWAHIYALAHGWFCTRHLPRRSLLRFLGGIVDRRVWFKGIWDGAATLMADQDPKRFKPLRSRADCSHIRHEIKIDHNIKSRSCFEFFAYQPRGKAALERHPTRYCNSGQPRAEGACSNAVSWHRQ